MTDLLDLSDRILDGVADAADHHPFAPRGVLAEVADDTAFVESFANVSALRTGDGLVLVDTGSPFSAADVHRAVRGWDGSRVHTAVYTHGHIDHVFGTAPFEEEARAAGDPPLEVVAHEAVPHRFDRYEACAGYNAVINQRQFRAPGLRWPTDYRRPDTTYRDRLDLSVGGVALELHHARGETDDATWVWVPERRAVCTGDLVIWCAPNAGNPQKVQRYAADWAVALRAMAALEPELLLPGHGLPVRGRARVQAVLTDTATLLEVLHDQTLALMNEGARLDDIVHTVRAPEELLAKPYLRPIYDDPEFLVRGVWRLYGGWYDGNPAHLKPAPDAALAAEVASLAGGASALADRARALVAAGSDADLRVAGHLAEMAVQAGGDDPGLHRARAEVFGARARAERSLMAQGVFRWAAQESDDAVAAAFAAPEDAAPEG
ncbi:alkyl sulfatase dimerization domain-containing protein [Iamia majanohamensis]|uniref:Alkyl sulfatase dimerization domain-containing protein n=1 Tax=Iamia majanohamensis TaxID=467976 RepID=A0AAF0BUM6_9ACTN|nr:alkyl sulfatase dimerization domain-containing protein [Iamia majanohamensis]WCO65920.1 alkyl sulfatase dimerization domain-containing protein [Iamia majanohamensis]